MSNFPNAPLRKVRETPLRPARGITIRGDIIRLKRLPGGETYANPQKPLTLRQ